MEQIIAKISTLQTLQEVENLRVEIMGKKGILTQQFAELKNLPDEQKKIQAKILNTFKQEFESKLTEKKESLFTAQMNENLSKEAIDASLFSALRPKSSGHPIYQTMDRIIDFFVNMNFSIQSGPLVEDDFHNFEALNLPKFHPARDMQDTFYFKDSMLLRTHTSPVQIRTMEKGSLPIRMIAPGKIGRASGRERVF